MATKKKAARAESKRTLEDFKQDLKDGKFNVVVGARRSASYLVEKDRPAALKLVAAHFGIGVDEPGEATRGKRRTGKKMAVRKTKQVRQAGPAKEAKKKLGRRPKVTATPEPVTTDPAPEVAKKRATRKSAAKEYGKPVIGVGQISEADRIFHQVGVVGGLTGTVDQAIRAAEFANNVAGKAIDLTQFMKEATETLGAIVRSVRRLVPAGSDTEAKQLAVEPLQAMDGERETNHQAAAAAAAAVGVQVPAES